jgi:hypothetical protein
LPGGPGPWKPCNPSGPGPHANEVIIRFGAWSLAPKQTFSRTTTSSLYLILLQGLSKPYPFPRDIPKGVTAVPAHFRPGTCNSGFCRAMTGSKCQGFWQRGSYSLVCISKFAESTRAQCSRVCAQSTAQYMRDRSRRTQTTLVDKADALTSHPLNSASTPPLTLE